MTAQDSLLYRTDKLGDFIMLLALSNNVNCFEDLGEAEALFFCTQSIKLFLPYCMLFT